MAKTQSLKTVKSQGNGLPANGAGTIQSRKNILKTYKIFIGGAFPRTESGRYYQVEDSQGKLLANVCRSSRKDFRNAVVAARKAFGGWSGRSSFNRGQILYRIAEMLEGRRAQFETELQQSGLSRAAAVKEVNISIDRLVYYAGWADKYQQIFSSVNPVNSSHFNFSLCEATGVVAVIAPEEASLLGLVSTIAPVITGGNTCIVLASESRPLSSITFAEVLNTSDLPGGVVNILTGFDKELASHFSSHMDVNGIWYTRGNNAMIHDIQKNAVSNLKRVNFKSAAKWADEEAQSPYLILDHQEIKTTWHPIGY